MTALPECEQGLANEEGRRYLSGAHNGKSFCGISERAMKGGSGSLCGQSTGLLTPHPHPLKDVPAPYYYMHLTSVS